MKPRLKAPIGNLDSLVDTVTNVVGVVIFVVIAAHLNVQDTYERLKGSDPDPEVTKQKLDQARQEAERLRQFVAQLQERWGKTPKPTPEERQQLENLKRLIADLEKENRDRRPFDASPDDLAAKIADWKNKVVPLEKDIADARDTLARAKARPQTTVLPPIEVMMPDPQPPPAGTTAVHFVCRNGRILSLNTDVLAKKFEGVVRTLVKQPTGNIGIDVTDVPKICNYFDTHDIGDPFFRLRCENLGMAMIIKYEQRKQDQGETLDQIQQPTSAYAQAIRKINPAKNFVKFLVWPDAFEVYLAARKLVQEPGDKGPKSSDKAPKLLAGWVPYDVGEPLSEMIGGGAPTGGAPRPEVD